MKTTKRILACMLIVVMLAAMLCVGAGAVDITIKGNDKVTYTAYKVFGVEGTSKDAVLYTWANTSTVADAVSSLVETTDIYVTFKQGTTAAAFAEAVINNSAAFAATSVTLSGTTGTISLDDGYYVIKTSANSTPFAFSVIGGTLAGIDSHYAGTTITDKSGLPTIEKKVNGKDADVAAVGEELTYTITVTAEANAKNYQIVDSLPAGITVDTNTVKVKFVDVSDGNKETEITDVTTLTNDNRTITVDLADYLTANADNIAARDKFVVTYKAKLNDGATVGGTGNTNAATLTFGDAVDDNKLSLTADAVVYTLQIIVNKTNNQMKELTGATFSLYKTDSGTDVLVKKIVGTDLSTFTWSGLAEGSYKLVEDEAPAGYSEAKDVTFTIVELTSESTTSTALDFNASRGTVNLQDGSVTMTITNTHGTPLPETGGIGTTGFYAIGSLLVVGAIAVLLMKKRGMAE